MIFVLYAKHSFVLITNLTSYPNFCNECSDCFRKMFRKTLNLLLTAEIDNEEWKPVLESLGVECTLESALLMAQIKEAMQGNTKAAYFVAQYAGQNAQTAADDKEQQRRTERMEADTEKIRRSSGNAENEDEGVEIINDAPEETSQDIGYSDSEVPADIQ